MRLDKFLNVTGIVRRRTAAKDFADAGRIEIDGRPGKPSSTVQVGQRVTLNLGRKVATYEVLRIPAGSVRKDDREQYARLLGERLDPDW